MYVVVHTVLYKQDGKPNVIAKYGMAMGDTRKATTIQLAVLLVGFEYFQLT